MSHSSVHRALLDGLATVCGVCSHTSRLAAEVSPPARWQPGDCRLVGRVGWLRKATILFMFAMVPGVPLVTLLERVEFQSSLIRRRTWYGKWIEYSYQDIVRLEVFEHDLARLRFRDDRVLKIWGRLMDPCAVESIVKAQARHRFETVDGQ
jgi:hypothetical protein